MQNNTKKGQIANKTWTKTKREFLTWVEVQFHKSFGLKSVICSKSHSSIVAARISCSFSSSFFSPISSLYFHFFSSFCRPFSLFLSLFVSLLAHTLFLDLLYGKNREAQLSQSLHPLSLSVFLLIFSLYISLTCSRTLPLFLSQSPSGTRETGRWVCVRG